MKCKKCNIEVPNEAKFCMNCGASIDDSAQYNEEIKGDNDNEIKSDKHVEKKDDSLKRKNKINKKIAIIILVIAVVIISGIICCNNIYKVSKKVNNIISLIENKKYIEAKTVYNEIKNNTEDIKNKKIIEKTINKLRNQIDDKAGKYINNKLKYDELNRFYTGLIEIEGLDDKITENTNKVNVYKKSRESMKKAINYMENKSYIEAIKEYKKVSEKDQENYSVAQNNLDICLKEMYDYYIDKADKLRVEKKMSKLIKQLKF